MNYKQIHDAIDTLSPTEEVKQEILQSTLSKSSNISVLPNKRKKNKKHIFQIVAAATILLCICTLVGATVYANNFFGLRDLLISSSNPSDSSKDSTSSNSNEISPTIDNDSNLPESEDNISSIVTPEPVVDMISIQGYSNSIEYQASKEWYDFVSNYDTDGAIINQVGNSNNEYTLKYPLYNCYSKEMIDTLEGIITKYNLQLHETFYYVESIDELYTYGKTGTFIIDNQVPVYSGYAYNDGSLHFDSDINLSGIPTGLQFSRSVKGVFSDVYLNIWDASAYTEWTYETSTNANVTLALGTQKGLILYDADESFILVNVLAGTNGGLTTEDMQTLADMFDFNLIP